MVDKGKVENVQVGLEGEMPVLDFRNNSNRAAVSDRTLGQQLR